MLYSFLFVILTAISSVLVQKLDSSITPLLTLLITSLITSIYFNIVNFHKLKSTYQLCWQNKQLWASMMFTVLVMWACSMISPGLIGASMHIFLYFSWRGILGFLSIGFRNKFNNRSELYCSLMVLFLIFINVFFQLHSSFSENTLLGIFISLLGGTTAFIYFKQSQSVVKKMNLTATQILAVRFHLSVLVLLPILLRPDITHQLTLNNTISLICLAFISMIIPLYFGQKALEKISSEHHAIITSVSPVATGILQEIIFKDVKMVQALVYAIYALIIAGYYFVKKARQRAGVAA